MHTDTTLNLSDWLYCPGSLTQQLKDRVGTYELRILSQIWIDKDDWLPTLVPDLPFPVFQREIVICADSTPCWFSRSYFSQSLYQNEAWLIARMQTEPLGHILFTDSRIKRVAFDVLTIQPQDAPWYWSNFPLLKQNRTASMRLAQYRVGNEEGLWISELFLQGLEEVL